MQGLAEAAAKGSDGGVGTWLFVAIVCWIVAIGMPRLAKAHFALKVRIGRMSQENADEAMGTMWVVSVLFYVGAVLFTWGLIANL
ncbi:hypothetical protein [Yinghuangia seranimata]|uniref:hypothetical protein n=1 Tax=Yinghuangia seranimata TaxID=408067 RepID=UPI00248BA5D0|nr:hypothetical protein [Yinghuangia seranimata]MDI2125520.1 hypothetical protein [Yinghuangia seranimata]